MGGELSTFFSAELYILHGDLFVCFISQNI